MDIDITKLKSGINKKEEINETYLFTDEQLKQSNIIKMGKIKVEGTLSFNNLESYYLDISVKGKMELPCSISLKPVEYPFNIKIEGNIEELLQNFDKNYKNTSKTIDILPIIWENILMEIPIRIVSDDLSDVKTEGNGWTLITDEKNI